MQKCQDPPNLLGLFKAQGSNIYAHCQEFLEVYIQVVANSSDAELPDVDNIRKEINFWYFNVKLKFEELTPSAKTPFGIFNINQSHCTSFEVGIKDICCF